MFSSDVSARGVDYPDVTLVIQVGVPADKSQYDTFAWDTVFSPPHPIPAPSADTSIVSVAQHARAKLAKAFSSSLLLNRESTYISAHHSAPRNLSHFVSSSLMRSFFSPFFAHVDLIFHDCVIRWRHT